MKKNFEIFLVVSLLAIGAFLRLYHFPDRVIYGPEQAISLSTAAANLDKFSLIGEHNLQRFTSAGHNLIHGPLFSYFLLPFELIFNFKVLPISLVFVVLNLLTALVFYFVTKKIFGPLVALFSLLFFLISDVMIYHSLFIWIYNPLPLLGVASIWFLYKLINSRLSLMPIFWLGLFSGIGFSLQYPYLTTAVGLFFLVVALSKRHYLSAAIYLLGFFLANSTRVVFDLKHDFYHLRTLWQFFIDVYVDHSVSGTLYYYSYLHLYPLLYLFFGLVATLLFHYKKLLAIILFLIISITSLSSPRVNLSTSTGMPPGLNLSSIEQAAAEIAADKPPTRFNVVTLWDFDTLGRTLRYPLQSYYNLNPEGFDQYQNVDAIYAFAPGSRDIKAPRVYELNVFLPYQVKELPSPAAGYKLYKLTK